MEEDNKIQETREKVAAVAAKGEALRAAVHLDDGQSLAEVINRMSQGEIRDEAAAEAYRDFAAAVEELAITLGIKQETQEQPEEEQAPDKKKNLPKASARRPKTSLFPVSPLTREVFSKATYGKTVEGTIDTAEKEKRTGRQTIFYRVDWQGLKEMEASGLIKTGDKLTRFDFGVLCAVASLYGAGNDLITVQQISRAIGGSDNPSPQQIKKIRESLEKMRWLPIYIDNTEEAKRSNYALFDAEGPAVHLDIVRAVINGQVTEKAYRILSEPLLIMFARERGQVEEIPLEVLRIPVNRSEQNLAIQDFLLWRIFKHGMREDILLETMFEECQVGETWTQRKRAIEAAEKILAHYKEEGVIDAYEIDGRKIRFTRAEKPDKKPKNNKK